ncbi:hypothetical protein ElyMa_001885400 [Elysia marginata]|uniref:Uncharacterized protein n=1 Tax=Elysia marginata TaxID=1093978 RepID=A0AAV4EQD0_9GAST|nr:hypothetical protein ElyMa_001885400 [Elysia marginata]
MGCSASTSTSVSTTQQARTMNDLDPAMAGRSKASSLSSKKGGDVHQISSGTHISTKTPKEKGTGRKTSKDHKQASPYSVDLTKEMKPMRKVSANSVIYTGREGAKRSSASLARKAENQRILEEEPVSYIMCSTKTPKEALPPIRTSHTGSAAPAVSLSSLKQTTGPELQTLESTTPLSPIPRDKKPSLSAEEKVSEKQKLDSEKGNIKTSLDKIPLQPLSNESNPEDNRATLEYVNGDILKTELDERVGDNVTTAIKTAGVKEMKEGDNELEKKSEEYQIIDNKICQNNDPLEEALLVTQSDPGYISTPTKEVQLNPIQDVDQTENSSSNISANDQQHRHHHHHHHNHQRHHHHHHHHRRGHHHQHHHHQHHHHNSDQRSGSAGSGGGGGGGSASPEKTIKFMSKDAKTQFVFRAIKSREEESESSNERTIGKKWITGRVPVWIFPYGIRVM